MADACTQLSLRQPFGVTGDILVDGKEPPKTFARNVGFAEQHDLHLPSATVREAIEFAAILRQPPEVPMEEKLNYVQVSAAVVASCEHSDSTNFMLAVYH